MRVVFIMYYLLSSELLDGPLVSLDFMNAGKEG